MSHLVPFRNKSYNDFPRCLIDASIVSLIFSSVTNVFKIFRVALITNSTV